MQLPGAGNPLLCGLPLGSQYNWGLGGMLTVEDLDGKRKSGTLTWGGMPTLVWQVIHFIALYIFLTSILCRWIDPSSQLAALWATQMFPPAEDTTVGYINKFESAVYAESNQKQRL